MEKNITALFEISVPKSAKNLTKFVGKDEYRPALKYVCIEPTRGLMAASDTHVLRTDKIECNGEWPEGLQVLVDPKHIAKIAGKTAKVEMAEEEREIEEQQKVYRHGRQCYEPVKVKKMFNVVRIECNGENYTTEYRNVRFPDVVRVIPNIEQMKAIRFNAENIEALKTVCKLATNPNYITLSAERGSSRLIVADVNEDYNRYASYSLELAEDAELDITIGLNPAWLANCLTGSNGTIRVIDECRPAYFVGDSEHTICMPVMTMQRDREYIEQIRRERLLTDRSFAYDLERVMEMFRAEAVALWENIKDFNKLNGDFTPGNYSAKDIQVSHSWKSKCGFYAMPDRQEHEINITYGNISLSLDYSEMFKIFAIWESGTRAKKVNFAVGNIEETTETVMVRTESGAEEKKMKLRKLGGNWYCDAKRAAKDYDVLVYCQLNGVIFSVDRVSYGHIDDPEKWAAWVENHESRLIELLPKCAEKSPYYAEICRLAGIYATSPEEAKANIEADRAEREREHEEWKHKQMEELRAREEAEAKRKENLLAEGKKKLLAGDKISVEQIELIAENVGYKINIRTIGTMREKLASISIDESGAVSYSYYKTKNTSARSFEGICKTIRELYDIIKRQVAETPQISTESAETKEVSAEEEKREETANYRISRHSHDDYAKVIVGNRNQSKVIAILLTIGNKSYIEINDESAGLATIGQMPLQIAKPITELTDMEVLELLYGSPQPPTEPPQDTQTDGQHDIPPKPKEAVRNVSAAPPEPPKAIHTISGPPGFKFSITPTINKNLILQNHDRNNCLAPPHLHNRPLRLPRLPGGSGCNLRHLCLWNPHIVASCQVDRQVGKKESRGSPRRAREGDQRMGEEMGKKASYTQIGLPRLEISKIKYIFTQSN